jgi:hypothetical protein
MRGGLPFLSPPSGLDTSEVLKPIDEREVAGEMESNDELRESSEVLRAWIHSFEGSETALATRQRFGGADCQPEVVFLGTGAAIPSKYRNGNLPSKLAGSGGNDTN